MSAQTQLHFTARPVMNLLNQIHNCVRRNALRTSAWDCRFAVLLAWLGVLAALAVSNVFIPYQRILSTLGVPPVTPMFTDLRAVLGGFEATRLGYDVLLRLPIELYSEGRLIYPRLWMRLEWLGLGLQHAPLLGIAGAVCFVLVTLKFVGRLNRFEALAYALILCSPPALLLFERGNVDIVLYLLLFLSLLAIGRANAFTRFLGYWLVLLPACLKLLPILTLSMALKESRSRFLLYVGGILAAFLAYMRLASDEMKIIRSFYGGTEEYSFGSKVLYWSLSKALKLLLHSEEADLSAILAAVVVALSALVCALALATIAFLAFRQFRNWCRSDPGLALAPGRGYTPSFALDAFRAGATLYLFTFVLGVVFDYKLIFLILTVPQMLRWIKTDERLGPVSSLALLGLVATCYFSPLLFHWAVDELVNWLLWAYLCYAFALTLPHWTRALVHEIGARVFGTFVRDVSQVDAAGAK